MRIAGLARKHSRSLTDWLANTLNQSGIQTLAHTVHTTLSERRLTNHQIDSDSLFVYFFLIHVPNDSSNECNTHIIYLFANILLPIVYKSNIESIFVIYQFCFNAFAPSLHEIIL